jgi:hypothetical protein
MTIADPESRMESAVAEIKALILQHFPDAEFEIGLGEDPDGTWMTVTVDIDDTDDVIDVIVGRLLDMQVEEGIPLYVIPVQPTERILAEFRAQNPDWNRLLPSFG